MATYYGSWVGTGRTGRLRVEVSGIPAITSDTGPFTVTSDWYAEFSVSTWDGGVTFDTNGTFEAAPTTVPVGTSSNPVVVQYLGRRTATITPRFDNTVSIAVQGTFTGANNIGTSTIVSINATITVPRKPYKAPHPPADFSFGLSGARQATLWWSGVYTSGSGAYPWSGVRVRRWDNVGGWVDPVASLGWDAVTWSDSSLADDRAYKFEVRSENVSGTSAWVSYSDTLYTKPLAPTGVQASKDTTGAIVVTWTSPSTTATSWRVYHNDETDPIATVTTQTWKHVGASTTETHTYRVVALAPNGSASDKSTASGSVQLLTAPNAPTGLAPSGITLNRSSAHDRTWQHNSRDGTPQSAYEVSWRTSTDSGSTWSSWSTTNKVVSTASKASLGANWATGNTVVQWQVRTWGGHADPSGWSAVHTYTLSSIPTATITSPTANQSISTDVVTVTWTYAGSAIQASYMALLRAGGNVVETRTGNGTGASVAFAYRLSNQTAYTIELTVTDANGLSSSKVSRSFQTQFIGPPPAQSVATWDDGMGAVTLSLTNPPPGSGIPQAVSTSVERLVDGKWYSLGTWGLDATLTDPIPTLGEATYRLTTTSSLGASTSVEVSVPTPNVGDWIWVNYGPTFGLRARVRLNAHTSTKRNRPRTRHHFAGRRRAVSYHGDEREFTVAVSALTEESDTLGNRSAWYRASDEGDLICYRDHLGRRFFGTLSDISFDEESDDLSSLIFSVEEDDYEE